MIEWIKSLDEALFVAINRGFDNPFFNFLMPWLREPLIWVPLYLFIIGLLIYRLKRRSILWIFGLILAVGLADYEASGLFKPNFKRLRPCHETSLEGEVILRKRDGNCGGKYGFASSHASNHFAMASFISLALGLSMRNYWRWLLYVWAGLIGFAQVYVGVHYPGDVLVGALLGIVAARILYQITLFAEQKIYR
ncbi:MAG: phosphatase PAP2 family protein [Bacteroidetes bacterium]|nr:phosphatase PAP2 family protein [Bacteroidota bacterium]